MIPDSVTDLDGLAQWFDQLAERENEMVHAFRIGGRYQQARRCETQATLWAAAAAAVRLATLPDRKTSLNAGSTAA